MKNDRFDPDAGLENLDKLPEDLREPLKEGVSKCRKADEGTKFDSIHASKRKEYKTFVFQLSLFITAKPLQ
jgi:hypothetical protein